MYEIAIFNDATVMVDGVVARWDDYDYCDPDRNRQNAMTNAFSVAEGSIFGHVHEHGIGQHVRLSNVLRFLHKNTYQLAMGNVSMTSCVSDDDFFSAQADVTRSIEWIRNLNLQDML